ncbi:hypothetical protein AwDysgo_15090 [Bacteroidales bacterium]|nr:hypothetical protein AwDysgo_15090 [Bacteroidales bacterium]
MDKYGSQEEAIRRAERQHKTFEDERYATHNPCTTIYELVKQLLGKDQSLIDEVMKKHNSAE